jgi:long-chain acyl-CoA synthetase
VTATLTLHRHAPATTTPAAPPLRAPTIVGLFRDAALDRGTATALRHHDGTGWQSMSWLAYERAVAEVAVGLRSWGLEPGDRVGILSGNRPEWHIADLGILGAGLVSTPVYATNSSSQAAYVLRDAECRVAFVEDAQQLAKVLLRRDELPLLERVVVLSPIDGVDDAFVRPLADLRHDGATELARHPDRFAELAADVAPDDLATLVYTSGTTGPPKGAMITHANAMATLRSLSTLVGLSPADRFLSFLPLSHITERSVSHFGQIAAGGETWFARSLATVAEDLRACRPTLFFAVPRVWEKFREAVLAGIDAAPSPLRRLLTRYVELAGARQAAGSGWGRPAERAELAMLDRTVGAALRRKLGLDHARLLSCGAAAVHPDLLRWFHAIGLPIAEGYGQTEVSLCSTLNPVEDIRIGTVGRAIPGVEVRVADDGEILVRGAGVCAGYWHNDAASADLVDADGWLRTGDLGELDDDGYLRVTGRKKDLIITSYGKNIAPSEIETALRYEPLISQAVVVGDGRPFLTALLTLDADAAADWAGREGRNLALDALAGDDALRAAIDEAVERVNVAHSHAEGIRRWRLLPRDLTTAGGELTPTLKVRREVVTAAFADLIEEMYAEPDVR